MCYNSIPFEMHAGADAEWHKLRHVMVHEPGIEVFFALLSPAVHLYERFFNLNEAGEEHRHLCSMLKDDFGIEVTHLTDKIREKSLTNTDTYKNLINLAKQRMGQGPVYPPPLHERDPGHLLDIVILNPSLVRTCGGNTFRTELARPLYNLYFMRDQQAATDRGIVEARMAKRERLDEVALADLGLRATGVHVVHRVENGRFEGGDFMPADDFALIGCGSRTDRQGVDALLNHAVGFDEVAIVHEPRHPLIRGRDPMVCMHLDTWFNIAGDGVAVGNPHLLSGARVEICHRGGDAYKKDGEVQQLDYYLREHGFEIIEITTLEQLCYAANFLCVRDGECITPDTSQIAPVVLGRLREKCQNKPEKYGSLLRQAEHDYQLLKKEDGFFPDKKAVSDSGIDMYPLVLTNATGGYGGAHCMTGVLSRR